MTDAREKVRSETLLGAIAHGIWQGHRRRVKHYRYDWAPLVISALTTAGFRVLGPDEIDGPTVEKCAVEMEVNWGHVCTPELRDAIRALQEKQT